jgi:hypothetical protein
MRERRLAMQEHVRAALRKAVAADRGRPIPRDDDDGERDFGFYHPAETVLSVWFALRNWKVLPVAGGWLDQPEAWQHDILMAQTVYNDEWDQDADGDGPTVDDLLSDADAPRLKMFGE